jgi:hypothetical protein
MGFRNKFHSHLGPRYTLSQVQTSTTRGVSRVEIRNLLENFKIDILGTLTFEFDNLKVKQKKEEEN